jgi:hypothetical protein
MVCYFDGLPKSWHRCVSIHLWLPRHGAPHHLCLCSDYNVLLPFASSVAWRILSIFQKFKTENYFRAVSVVIGNEDLAQPMAWLQTNSVSFTSYNLMNIKDCEVGSTVSTVSTGSTHCRGKVKEIALLYDLSVLWWNVLYRNTELILLFRHSGQA